MTDLVVSDAVEGGGPELAFAFGGSVLGRIVVSISWSECFGWMVF